jgi:sugar phosphate isomerase/epimerase
MRLGVLTSAVLGLELEDGLARLKRLGLDAVEVACGGYFGTRHAPVDVLLESSSALASWRDCFLRNELEISALALHGEPLSPDEAAARAYADEFRQICRLAEAIGVDRLTLLAGLPEAAPGDRTPCWITQPFPDFNVAAYRWQWEERLIPYWVDQGAFAREHGCRLCFEMVPGDMVYNPAALLKLREAVGPVIGCNFDPSHLVWQGIDVPEALRALGEAVYHVHAKDVRVQSHNVRVDGVLDPKPYSELTRRAWTFRTVGYGHGEPFWREVVSTLRLIGYDDVLSIEHEDEYLDSDEGLEKAVAFLRPILLREPPGRLWWDRLEADAGSRTSAPDA